VNRLFLPQLLLLIVWSIDCGPMGSGGATDLSTANSLAHVLIGTGNSAGIPVHLQLCSCGFEKVKSSTDAMPVCMQFPKGTDRMNVVTPPERFTLFRDREERILGYGVEKATASKSLTPLSLFLPC
jgi:hypothetical protein